MSKSGLLPAGQLATLTQLESSLELFTLAIEEEPDEARHAELRMLQDANRPGLVLWAVREAVRALRARALPGGELDVKAGAWLALRENGGAA